jgi:hypothetical protein
VVAEIIGTFRNHKAYLLGLALASACQGDQAEMKVTNVALVAALVWAGTMWAQSATPETAPASVPTAPNITASNQAPPAPVGQSMGSSMPSPEMGRLQRMQEMQDTLGKMHLLLKDMQAKVASGNSESQSAMMDNVQMWQMILEHLDQNLAQARGTTVLRGSPASSSARRSMTRRSGGVPTTPAMPAAGGTAAPASQ